MFDFIRKHTRITMALLFLLIVPSFVLFGLDGYTRDSNQGTVVAKVDGQKIMQSDWDRAHQADIDRLSSSMPTVDIKLLDTPEARYASLERLVRDRVIASAAQKFNFTTSDQQLARELQKSPEIAALRQADGSMDMQRYRQLLAAQGMTPAMFEGNVRSNLSTVQVLSGITNTGLPLTAVADTALTAFLEKREIQIQRFETAKFAAKLSPAEADLQAFYKINEKRYQAPEQANIEYVVLDTTVLQNSVVVNEDELKALYTKSAPSLGVPEERRASHILIAAAKTAPADEREKAKAKAGALLLVVQKAPDSFADVARKNSQDPGSAVKGGDLDFFGRGAMVKPFEEAAFNLKKGEISTVVESDFGYHIIRLTDIKAGQQRTFEQARPGLEAQLKKQEAQKKFSESVEVFTNSVFEQSDSLKPVSEKLKLEVKTATNISRKPAANTQGVLGNTKFVNAIFGPDSLDKKRNTEAIEIAPGVLASGRITQYTPARTQPFADVVETVRKDWVNERGAEEARKEGIARLEALKKTPTLAGEGSMTAPLQISRNQTQNLPSILINAALRAEATTLPTFAGADLGAEGYAVIKVLKILPRVVASEPALQQQERNEFNRIWTNAESLAYYEVLKKRFKAEILVNKSAPSKTTTEEKI